MKVLILLSTLILSLAIPAHAQNATKDDPVSWFVSDMAQDNGGTIWSIGIQKDSSTNAVVRFDESTLSWESVTWPKAYAGEPQMLTTLSDGNVFCLAKNGPRSGITLQDADRFIAVGFVETGFEAPRILPLPYGRIAITERGPKVASMVNTFGESNLTTLTDNFLLPPEKQEDGDRSFAITHAVEAGDESLWLWSYALEPLVHVWRLRGILRVHEGKVDLIKHLPFDPTLPISAVIADGTTHMLVAQAGGELWKIPIHPGPSERVELPVNDFAYIEQMAWIGSALHLITCPKPSKVSYQISKTVKNHLEVHSQHFYEPGVPTGSVFRMTEGKPQLLAEGLDDEPGFGRSTRPIVIMDQGLLLGSYAGPPTFIPHNRASVTKRLDAEHGFHLRSAAQALPLRNGQVLVRSYDHHWCVVNPTASDDMQPQAPRFSKLRSLSRMVVDQKHRLWAWPAGENHPNRWDGEQWEKIPTPPVPLEKCISPVCDEAGNLWMIPRDGKSTAVFLESKQNWTLMPTIQKAVDAHLAPGHNIISPYLSFSILSNRAGDKGFISMNRDIFVSYDKTWFISKMDDIAGPQSSVSGQPSFDSDGVFRVSLNSSHFRYDKDRRWRKVPNADTSKDLASIQYPHQPHPDCPVEDAISEVPDYTGVKWVVRADGTLWKHLSRVVVKVGENHHQPVVPLGNRVMEILLDAKGGAFLRLVNFHSHDQYIQVRRLDTVAAPKPTLKRVGPDWILNANFPKDGWFSIQVDGSKWTAPQNTPEIKLDSLQVGNHTIAFRSYDKELNIIPPDHTLQFEVEAAASELITGWIKQLASPDLSTREAATKQLRKQDKMALPQLKTVRDKTPDEAHRWWIEAVIEAIEQKR